MEAYALLLAALILTGGALGDLYGRRKVFAAGVALFSLASVWCGLAPNIRHPILARGLQGIGGAMLVPGSLALISANFSEELRGRAIGTWSGFTSITAAIGPVLGGWFIEHGTAILTRLKRLEEVQAIENPPPVEFQTGSLMRLPSEYTGDRHLVTVSRDADGTYRWEERAGPEPDQGKGNFPPPCRVVLASAEDEPPVPGV